MCIMHCSTNTVAHRVFPRASTMSIVQQMLLCLNSLPEISCCSLLCSMAALIGASILSQRDTYPCPSCWVLEVGYPAISGRLFKHNNICCMMLSYGMHSDYSYTNASLVLQCKAWVVSHTMAIFKGAAKIQDGWIPQMKPCALLLWSQQ